MANYSDLFAPAPTSPIKSIQTGYVSVLAAAMSSGSGEDAKYLDVTISAVTVAKAKVSFVGSGGSNSSQGYITKASANSIWVTARLVGSTTLRLSAANSTDGLLGRWTVEEFN